MTSDEVVIRIKRNEQGGVTMHSEPSALELSAQVVKWKNRADHYGVALFLMRIAQMLFRGSVGLEEIIRSLKEAVDQDKREQSPIVLPFGK